IFSTMMGAIEIARMLPDPAIREKVLGSARDFLLRSFSRPQSLASDGQPFRNRIREGLPTINPLVVAFGLATIRSSISSHLWAISTKRNARNATALKRLRTA